LLPALPGFGFGVDPGRHQRVGEPQPITLDPDDRFFLGHRENVDQSVCVGIDRF
jgi:hypothetical protein